MSITYVTYPDAGVPCDTGRNGFMRAVLTLDGSATSKAVTLQSTDPIKTVVDVFGGTSHNITSAGVTGTTGWTSKFAAGTNGEFLSLLIYGKGR